MPSKQIAVEQAKQYSDDERVTLIRKFWSSGQPLNDFCTIKGHPPYHEMKRLLCTTATNFESSESPSLNHNTLMTNQFNHEQLNSIASTLAKLHIRLRLIMEEVESLMNGLHSTRPSK